MRRNSATARRSSQPRFRLFHLSQALIIILIECIFVVAENERSNEIFPFLAKAFWISVHTAEEFSRSQLSSVPLSLSLSLSLAISDFLLILSLSLSLYPPFRNLVIPRVLCIPTFCVRSPSFYVHPSCVSAPISRLIQPSSGSKVTPKPEERAYFVPLPFHPAIWFSLTRIVYLLAKYLASFDRYHPVSLSCSHRR